MLSSHLRLKLKAGFVLSIEIVINDGAQQLWIERCAPQFLDFTIACDSFFVAAKLKSFNWTAILSWLIDFFSHFCVIWKTLTFTDTSE